MRRTVAFGILMSALTLSGCGGTFDGDLANIYAGDWSGVYDDRIRPATGTVEWVITDDGVMTGSIVRDSDGQEGVFTGTIGRGGQFSGIADFDGALDFLNVEGFITRSNSSTFGSFSYTFQGSTTSATFTLSVAAGT